jgi:predicted house-cleaning NTP pyrophosphatase (Maf/HAM1 superfamily)
MVVPPIIYTRGFGPADQSHVVRHSQMHAEEAMNELMQRKVTFSEIKVHHPHGRWQIHLPQDRAFPDDHPGHHERQHVKKYQPLDKAGAYGIQDEAGLINRIEGSYDNVMGFPSEDIAWHVFARNR